MPPDDTNNGLTLKQLLKAKKILEDAEKKRPKIIIDGKEYILFGDKINA